MKTCLRHANMRHAQCACVIQGKVFNLLTEQHYLINVRMGRFKGPDQFPYNATW